jgi:DNA-binding MarR family transcriptional regulator
MGVRELQRSVRELVRALGVLSEDQTPCGVSIPPREAHALLILLESEAQRTVLGQADLQRIIGIDKSNIARLVQRLGERGWVSQSPDADDGRRRILGLTARGRSIAASLDERSGVLFQSLWRTLDRLERDEITRGLQRLCAALRDVAMKNVEYPDKEPSRAK